MWGSKANPILYMFLSKCRNCWIHHRLIASVWHAMGWDNETTSCLASPAQCMHANFACKMPQCKTKSGLMWHIPYAETPEHGYDPLCSGNIFTLNDALIYYGESSIVDQLNVNRAGNVLLLLMVASLSVIVTPHGRYGASAYCQVHYLGATCSAWQ